MSLSAGSGSCPQEPREGGAQCRRRSGTSDPRCSSGIRAGPRRHPTMAGEGGSSDGHRTHPGCGSLQGRGGKMARPWCPRRTASSASRIACLLIGRPHQTQLQRLGDPSQLLQAAPPHGLHAGRESMHTSGLCKKDWGYAQGSHRGQSGWEAVTEKQIHFSSAFD